MEHKNEEADKIINNHLTFAMVAGAIPVPLADVAAVTAIQMDMLSQLAKLYEVDFSKETGKSLVASLVGTSVGTSLGRMGASAVKAIPGIGTILGIGSQVVLSGATTFAIGKVFQGHFQQEGSVVDFSVQAVKEKFEELLNIGKNVAKEKNENQSEEEIMATIAKLSELQKSGAITEAEFKKTKTELLAKLSK